MHILIVKNVVKHKYRTTHLLKTEKHHSVSRWLKFKASLQQTRGTDGLNSNLNIALYVDNNPHFSPHVREFVFFYIIFNNRNSNNLTILFVSRKQDAS